VKAVRGRITYGTPQRFFVNDVEVTAEAFAAAFPPKPVAPGDEVLAQSTSAWKDFTSEALAVHPDQVGEANARSKRHNLGVAYDKDGFAHIPDRAARRRLLRVEGMHDNHGGYSD
jgi:chloramphenicol 3-O-phosphotransferase